MAGIFTSFDSILLAPSMIWALGRGMGYPASRWGTSPHGKCWPLSSPSAAHSWSQRIPAGSWAPPGPWCTRGCEGLGWLGAPARCCLLGTGSCHPQCCERGQLLANLMTFGLGVGSKEHLTHLGCWLQLVCRMWKDLRSLQKGSSSCVLTRWQSHLPN